MPRFSTNSWLKWICSWVCWENGVSALNLTDRHIEEADKYVEQELQISQTAMMGMENHLHTLMEQQQKEWKSQITSCIF